MGDSAFTSLARIAKRYAQAEARGQAEAGLQSPWAGRSPERDAGRPTPSSVAAYRDRVRGLLS